MLVIAAMVLSLGALCALAALVLQGFFYSRKVGLLWLAMVLLGSALGTTARYQGSPLWLALAAAYGLLTIAAITVLAMVVARNIRRPAIYIPLGIFAISAVLAAVAVLTIFAARA